MNIATFQINGQIVSYKIIHTDDCLQVELEGAAKVRFANFGCCNSKTEIGIRNPGRPGGEMVSYMRCYPKEPTRSLSDFSDVM